ncbi:carboxylesterase/lipase family protein [Pseudonocardiaceae bacterium YIM PH 21723]|nr:carboxylesterase/lipase family protein [Pseudonocardiaceae bacterium YIM PH 21723]
MSLARTTQGTLRGHHEDGVLTFRGVRYATAERFGTPRPVEPWTGVRDAVTDGPIAPQLPSRLEPVMGAPEPHEQGEDCLSLTITTPDADDRARPVLVFLHGGAWVSGAGSWNWYAPHRLTRTGDIVAVTVNYRLGALGYLNAPGISEGNLGLLDQLAALRWVRENIAAFGGDPERITIAGQSAGAHSVYCLLGLPEAAGLFRRAIVQSVPAGMGLGSPEETRTGSARFLGELGEDPRTAPIDRILAAQQRTMVATAGRFGLHALPPFHPGGLLTEQVWQATMTRRAPELDVLIGTTAEETAAFYRRNPVLSRVPLLERISGAMLFGRPSSALAGRLTKAGARVWRYRFDYAAPESEFGATHCIELPFLFGDQRAWAGSPMLAGATERELEELRRPVQAAWLGFISQGDPGWDRVRTRCWGSSRPGHAPAAGTPAG